MTCLPSVAALLAELRALRLSRSMSMTDVAREMHKPYDLVSRLENNRFSTLLLENLTGYASVMGYAVRLVLVSKAAT